MSRFKGFVIKEFYHIFRDKRSMIILFGMPIIQILLFGFAITNEINHVNIAIINHSNDTETQKIIQKLEASKHFDIQQYISSTSDIEKVFRQGKAKAVLYFEPQFQYKAHKQGTATIQVITDATEPNTANTVVSYLQAIIAQYQQQNNQDTVPAYQIVQQTRMQYNPELKSVFTFVPGVMTVILMLVSAMMTSISITREKEMGTMEVLLVSPLKPFQVIIGKVFPYVFLSVINALIILCLGYFVFGVPIKGSLVLLALVSVLFIITALSLGILISTLANTQQTAMFASLMGLMLPVIILSGFIFPISSMPLPMQVISNIIPAKWFIIILKAIMLKGVGLQHIAKEVLILIVMTLVFLGISAKKYKIRLE